MKLYLAGLYTAACALHSNFYRRSTPIEQKAREGVKFLLESYHYVHSERYVEAMRRDKCRIFLDSGAFSAFSLGAEIDLAAYCVYCKKNEDIIDVISVLDGIGDPLKTYQNQLAMEARGVRPLPCFHYGEDERYLEWYLQHYDHITLGGMVPIAKDQLFLWLDRIWGKYLTFPNGMPRLKVHGFGLTRLSLMERYPWYSIDSSSWVQIAAHGGILIPEFGVIFVSSSSPTRKEEGRHFTTMPPPEQQVIRAAVEGRGFDLDRMMHERIGRWNFNMLTFGELSNPDQTPKPFIPDNKGFF